MSLVVVPLSTGWSVQPVAGPVPAEVAAAGPVPATVPGSVHTDLLAAGLVPEPFEDAHERLLGWVGLCTWRYRTTVEELPAGDRVTLVAHGLDTVARVEVDGEVVLESRDMHRTFGVDLTGRVRVGSTLEVTFASAVREADRASLELGARPHTNHHPYNALRKMACGFGWDWGPDFASCGIWRPLELHGWSTARLDGVRPHALVDDADHGTLQVHAEVAGEREGLRLRARLDGRTETVDVPADGPAALELDAGTVRRWWPRGHGEQARYEVTVELLDAAGTVLDRWDGAVGFRTVQTETAPDADGTPFTLVVNGRPVFVKGVNWIPDDAFPHRVDRARLATILDAAEDAGVNLLRVWGGGLYESDDFYAECDRRGLMVWQDFLFACAAYAEEEPLRSEVEAEVRDNVTRLVGHPSLVLWNGNNENLWGFEDWEWQERLDGRTWGAGYYHELLPALLAELDPHRPYTPGSPFTPQGSASATGHPNDPAHGTVHVWDVWNARDWSAYRGYRPRFVAEWGWQAPPTWATLTGSVHDDPLTPVSPGMQVHQKAAEGDRKLTRGLVPHLRVPDDMEDWHWAMQLNQAFALRAGLEHFRSQWPRCAGSVYWQLNDCWPVTSWAVVDGENRRKPAFFALRRAHADRLVVLALDPAGTDDGPEVRLVNDTDEPWVDELVLSRRRLVGDVLAEHREPVRVAPRQTLAVAVPAAVATAGEAREELVLAAVGAVRTSSLLVEDRDSALRRPELDARLERTDDGYRLEVTARVLVKDLTLLVDKVDPAAVVDDGLVTLLPGESATFVVRSAAEPDLERLTAPGVLRSVNQLVAGPGHR
ncbi:glycoside hydrolase family 2 protein [Desertihabitans brevis]|uniref:beta-mannosidase n=1 Tax=Desertihabitans brevis TaxID=2268447 RepID=A0A367YY63_9ACTN|nr:glycoside hydrolase family 2 protein [Desertihabitans brevis]RCK70667.1 glycoside hydrolase family 2 protein [Desertihabitans brevis]